MTTIKAVIGANLGDEGKGKMVDYFAYIAAKPCIVVCTNGGAQRGHTVVTAHEGQHIFHHFGSGTFAGADTYLPQQYIVNPILFVKELIELKAIYTPRFRVYMNLNCLCSTPYDMMINQIIEESRGVNKHGSCGIGIWETILRNEATVGEMLKMTDEDMRKYLEGVRDSYFIHRLKNKGIEIPDRWAKIYYSDELINHYIRDFRYMCSMVEWCISNTFLKAYNTIIFENGQGLLLDQNIKDSKYSTPSNTGSTDIRKMVDNVFDNDNDYEIEVCYVSRTYLTRHGEGELTREVSVNDLYIDLSTETNVWNKNQGVFRYGILDNLKELSNRVDEDFNKYWKDTPAIKAYAFTHWDEKKLWLGNEFRKGKRLYYGCGAERMEIWGEDESSYKKMIL